MKKQPKEAILAWFKVHERGTIETVSLALKLNSSTAYANLRAMVRDGDLKMGPEETVRDARGRAYRRFTFELRRKGEPEHVPVTLVQRALASRDALTLAWWGPRC